MPSALDADCDHRLVVARGADVGCRLRTFGRGPLARHAHFIKSLLCSSLRQRRLLAMLAVVRHEFCTVFVGSRLRQVESVNSRRCCITSSPVKHSVCHRLASTPVADSTTPAFRSSWHSTHLKSLPSRGRALSRSCTVSVAIA